MMKNILLLAFISTLLLVIADPTPFYHEIVNQKLSKDTPIINGPFDVPLYVVGSVNVNLLTATTQKLVVCIQENGIPLPNYLRFGNAGSCWKTLTFNPNPVTTTGQSFLRSLKKTQSNGIRNYAASVTIDNWRSGTHYFGVYYDASVKDFAALTLSFNITGVGCNNAAGNNCDVPIDNLPTTDKIDTSPGTLYYKYNVDPQANGDSLQSLKLDFVKNDTVSIFARYRGLPSATLNDVFGNNTITINEPMVGTWIIAVQVNESTEYQAQLTPQVCQNFSTGSDCKTKVQSGITNKFQLGLKIANQNDVAIYALTNVSFTNLLVSIYDESADNKALLYASYNRVPQLVNGSIAYADLSGCNGQYCNSVQSLSTRGSSVFEYDWSDFDNFGDFGDNFGTWYVTVLAKRNNTVYNIWYDTTCPNNCGNQGACGTTGDGYGKCTCNASFAGLACDPASNPWVEYVILIVIAALVLISAILGLIAWAYMRRRAQYVEVK